MFRSHKHVYAQVIDDSSGRTLAAASTVDKDLKGDVKYGGPKGERPALHEWRLRFPHPIGGAAVEVTAPVPPDLVTLDRARKMAPPVA